jgi:hypothetical protein
MESFQVGKYLFDQAPYNLTKREEGKLIICTIVIIIQKDIKMKRTLLLIAISGSLFISLQGCSKLLDKMTEQTVTTEYTDVDFTVDPGAAGTYSENIEVVTPNLDSILQYEGYDAGKVKSVKISDALIEAADGINFDPFGSFLVTLETSGQPAVKIAEATTVPTGVTEIALTKEGVNVIDYLKSFHLTIKVKTVLDQNLEVQRNLRAKVKYEIKVTL